MTDSIVWGPEIQVNGKRPEWLGGFASRIAYQRDGDRWYGPHEEWPDLWSEADIIENPPGWSNVAAIRLPADHPHYRQPTTPERDPALWDRMEALVRRMVNETPEHLEGAWVREARAIVNALPKPVDPDTQAAKAIVAEEWPNAAPENEHALVRAAWLGIRFSRQGDAA